MSWIILVILNLYYFAPSVFVDGAFEQGQESEYRKYWQQFMLHTPPPTIFVILLTFKAAMIVF